MKKRLRTFNLDDDVIHMLRFKAKNQSRYVNDLLRKQLFRDNTEERRYLDEVPMKVLASIVANNTNKTSLQHALYEFIAELDQLDTKHRRDTTSDNVEA